MQLTVDPSLRLIRSLIPGERTSLREARMLADLSEAALAECVSSLTAVLPELATPAGSLQLTRSVDLIDPDQFCKLLPEDLIARTAHVGMHAVCESTSTEVMTYPSPPIGGINLSLSEYQTGGRGRQGRSWKCGFAEGLCLTVATRLAAKTPIAPTLTMAIGVQLSATLEAYVTQPVLLKWPNDLILVDGKLGGILVELSTLPGGDHLMRIGVGINCVVPDVSESSGGLPALFPAALADHARRAVDRSQLAAGLVRGVVGALEMHGSRGFSAFHSDWQDRDYLRHQHVQVYDDERVRHGTARGIDENGALQVETDEGQLSLMSGEVRVRRR